MVAPGHHQSPGGQAQWRAFLQEIGAILEDVPARSSFFETLSSSRRLRLCREVLDMVRARMGRTLSDPLAAYPALRDFAVFAENNVDLSDPTSITLR